MQLYIDRTNGYIGTYHHDDDGVPYRGWYFTPPSSGATQAQHTGVLDSLRPDNTNMQCELIPKDEAHAKLSSYLMMNFYKEDTE